MVKWGLSGRNAKVTPVIIIAIHVHWLCTILLLVHSLITRIGECYDMISHLTRRHWIYIHVLIYITRKRTRYNSADRKFRLNIKRTLRRPQWGINRYEYRLTETSFMSRTPRVLRLRFLFDFKNLWSTTCRFSSTRAWMIQRCRKSTSGEWALSRGENPMNVKWLTRSKCELWIPLLRANARVRNR